MEQERTGLIFSKEDQLSSDDDMLARKLRSIFISHDMTYEELKEKHDKIMSGRNMDQLSTHYSFNNMINCITQKSFNWMTFVFVLEQVLGMSVDITITDTP